MEDKFVWDDQAAADLLYFRRQFRDNIDRWYILEQFKASKLPSKEYEIIAYQSTAVGHSVRHKCDDGFFRFDKSATNKSACLEIELLNWEIYSVKRLSDGEAFSVGDEITACGDAGVISSIVLYQDAPYPILKYKNDQRSTSIHNATKKTKQPLFITEDGKEIFEGDTFYEVGLTHWDILAESVPHNKPYDKYYKYFSTRPKAEEYILLNKPCLSLNDLLSVWDEQASIDLYRKSPLFKNFKELAKSKINQK